MKRHILCIVFFFTLLSAFGQNAVEEFASSLRRDRCSLYVYDLRADTLVAAYNDTVPLTPASITKSISVASTLLSSGTDFKYHTKIYGTGPVADGVLEGNLLIVGGGDPSLGAECDPKGTDIRTELTAAMKRAGITAVRGKILTDGSIFPGPATHPSWGSGDLAASYGTGCHGLNYRQNKSGKSAVKNPAATLRQALAQNLQANGITLMDSALSDTQSRHLLLDHPSPPISEIMRSCMMRSDNLYAEAILRTLPLVNSLSASTAKGVEMEKELWRGRGAPMQGVTLADGSGLSRQNKFTARFLGFILRQMAHDQDYASFFPLAGQEGTMKNMFKGSPLDSYIALKTGTMRGVRCLAGYMLDDDFAPTHAVVIMSNDAPGGPASVNSAAQKVLESLLCPQSSPQQ